MEYILFVLYFSFFLCLCALVCLYFSGCQEMTYKHEGECWSLCPRWPRHRAEGWQGTRSLALLTSVWQGVRLCEEPAPSKEGTQDKDRALCLGLLRACPPRLRLPCVWLSQASGHREWLPLGQHSWSFRRDDHRRAQWSMESSAPRMVPAMYITQLSQRECFPMVWSP